MNASHTPTIHSATAMFPGYSYLEAIRLFVAGVSEPLYGEASSAAIQLCPQSSGHLDEAAVEALAASHPDTAFRLHANCRATDGFRMLDASTFSDYTRGYYEALADRSHRLGATAYSLHAGYAANCDLATMIDNVHRIQDIFGPSCQVAVEGLYPNAHRPQLMDSWAAYEAVMRAGLFQAVDCSHINIVARREGSRNFGLLRELISSPNTIEIHVSDNNGTNDAHAVLEQTPWWWPAISHAGPNAMVFSESNQVRHQARAAAAAAA